MRQMELEQFCSCLGYVFRDMHLLDLALTHPSYASEQHREREDNQRLEFLGDAVLEIVMADYLFHTYPELAEGELSRLRSRLVCEEALCILAKGLNFGKMIRLSHGEELLHGDERAGTLADAYEAVIGAIYLDGGLENARTFILRFHEPLLRDPDGDWLMADAKSRLQILLQANHQQVRYVVVSQDGPVHAPTFCVNACQGEEVIGTGTGHSKKDAQQAAALDALKRIGVPMKNFDTKSC